MPICYKNFGHNPTYTMPRREHHRVYVVDLSPDVLLEPRFRKNNPAYITGKPCVDVGMTGLAPNVQKYLPLQSVGCVVDKRVHKPQNPRPYWVCRQCPVFKH